MPAVAGQIDAAGESVEFFGEDIARKWNLLIDGEVGEIAPMNCFESIMFDIQNRDFPLKNLSSEGEAHVLSRVYRGVARRATCQALHAHLVV